MKKYIFIIFIFTVFSFSTGKVIADFPDLLNPDRMVLGNEKIYIVQDFSIHIYSMKDYSLIKKVGKKGEGPGEYVGYTWVSLYENKLFVNSAGKLSIYDTNGELIRELRSNDSASGRFTPLKEKFIGRGIELDKDRNRFTLLNIYDKNLVREKTIVREPHRSSFEKGIVVVFDTTFTFHVLGDNLYLVNGRDFKIDVYGKSLKKEKTIQLNYKRVKFGEKDKNKVLENLRTNPRLKSFADEILKRQRYPEFYPAILGLYDNGKYLFVMTHRWEGDNIEFMIFDDNGKFVKQLFIPFEMKSLYRAYPWDIKGDRFYQLIENEDEDWKLHENIIDLK